MTAAMQRALRWLNDRGGSGVIDRYGRLVAAGEVAKAIDASTWLRLIAAGELFGGHNRISTLISSQELIKRGELEAGSVRIPGQQNRPNP